jgi:SAM-dependent methyltransferase
MSKNVFANYGNYYDLLYRDKDYKNEFKYIQNLLKKYSFKTKLDILEFGSGTGKHGNFLVKHGHNVHGIELSKEMILRSDLKHGFTCQRGDIRKVKVNRSFDVVISLFHVLNYQITNMSINQVFSNAFRHLRSGGLFIFDFWYSPAVNSIRPSIKIKTTKNKKSEVIRIAEPEFYLNKHIVNIKYSFYVKNLKNGFIKKFGEMHKLRHFDLLEIKKFSKMHNFDILCSEEFLTGLKLNQKTWGACVVLKKKN